MADIFDMTSYGIRQEARAERSKQRSQMQNIPANKQAVQQAGVDGLSQGDDAKALADMEAMRSNPKAGESLVTEGAQAPFTRSSMLADQVDSQHAADVDATTAANNISMSTKFKTAIHQTWVGAALIDAARRDTFAPDPNFNYSEHREELEDGLSQRSRDWLRTDSTSLAHAQDIRRRALEEESELQTVFSGGSASGTMYMLSAGVLDPVGLVAGLGIGKAAQLGGVGSRALMAAGRTKTAVASLAAENAAVGLSLEATERASGKYVTGADYARAAGMGALVGIAMSPVALRGLKPAAASEEATEASTAIREATEASNDIRARAAQAAGPGATEEEIAREANRIQVEGLTFAERARTAPVPEEEQFLPHAMVIKEDEAPAVRFFESEEDLAAFHKEIGTDLMTDEPAKASLIADTHAFARKFTEANPIDEGRLNTLLSKFEKLDENLSSDAQQLLRSNNPVTKAYGQIVLESTTGAGGRRTTAAIDKYMTEATMHEHVAGFEQAASEWARRQGIPWFKRSLSDEGYHRFNRELALYRESVNKGIEPKDVDPAIKAASDMLDAGYGQALREQKAVRVPGHETLPETSKGYFPHRLSPRKVASLTNEQQRALAVHFRSQLEEMFGEGFDVDKGAVVANRIVNRMRAEAEAGVAHNLNLRAREADRLVEQALKEAGIEQTEAQRIIGRMYSRGPGHTRHRLDLDLTAELKDPETGKSFQLLDFYDTDQLSLYRQYTNRTSGEMALAKRGIPGREGLDTIRAAMFYGKDGEKLQGKELERTLHAFDRTATEMLGTPYGKVSGYSNPAALNNLRMVASMTQLAGMGWNQLAEFANAIPAIGFRRAFASVPMMPRMLKEIRTGVENPVLKDLDSVMGQSGREHMIDFPYHDVDDIVIESGESMGVTTRAIREGSRKMRTLTLWRHIAAAQTRGMTELIVRKAFKYIKSGKEDAALNDMGIDEALRGSLRKHLNSIASFDNKGRLESLNLQELDPELVHKLATAVNRGTKQIIQESFVGERGKWAHEGFLKLLTQYRTFGLTSMEKQWTRVSATHGQLKALGYLVGTMSIAAPVYLSRIWASSLGRKDKDKYLEEHLTPYAIGRGLLNYSSLSGTLGDVLDIGAAGVGTADAMFGTHMAPASNSRAGTSGVSSVIPALGMTDDLMKAAQNPADLSRVLRIIPGGRLPYMVPLVNTLGKDKDASNGPI